VAGSSEASFRDLVQNAPDAFIVVDAKREITFFNDFTENLYGWRSEEIVGPR
jgi:PAS domain S-box-containing protein